MGSCALGLAERFRPRPPSLPCALVMGDVMKERGLRSR